MIEPKLVQPSRESSDELERIERVIRAVFRKEIYLPLIKELGEKQSELLKNSMNSLLDAIKSGRIEYYRGSFNGRWSSQISKELRALGAQWDRKTWTFKLPQSSLPIEIRMAISSSKSRFEQKIESVDRILSQMLPEKIADKVKVTKYFDTTLFKVERSFLKSVDKIAVAPQLTPEQRRKIAESWQENMDLKIKGWTQEEILKLRKGIQKTLFAGNRRESMLHTIQKSYDVGVNKAKFLARQETNLLISKFKEVRYQEAGSEIFKWRTVSGSPAHPVRPEHKVLDGKYFRWDDPREVNINGKFVSGGARKPEPNKNPKQDYNCRCTAIPVFDFKR